MSVASISINKLTVEYNGQVVGYLSQEDDGLVSFEYGDSYLSSSKMSVSPLYLPLKKGKFIPKDHRFEGLFGVFLECLPTGFSKLILKKHLEKAGINYDSLTPLTKLSLLLPSHEGGLDFSPCIFDLKKYKCNPKSEEIDLDGIKKRCIELNGAKTTPTILDVSLLSMGQGEDAIASYRIDEDIWKAELTLNPSIITDGQDKYDLYKIARNCDIATPNTLLCFSKLGQGNLTYKRYDRDENEKIHCLSLRSMLELQSFSSIDYLTVMQTIRRINDDEWQLFEMLKRITFLVALGINDYSPDDISFVYNKNKEAYELAPFSNLRPPKDFYEHQISANWKGHPRKEDIIEVARLSGLPYHESMDIINSVWNAAIKG